MFMREGAEAVVFTKNSFYAMTYIFAAGVFEMIFIYGFLRHEFERAFGIIPPLRRMKTRAQKSRASMLVNLILFNVCLRIKSIDKHSPLAYTTTT